TGYKGQLLAVPPSCLLRTPSADQPSKRAELEQHSIICLHRTTWTSIFHNQSLSTIMKNFVPLLTTLALLGRQALAAWEVTALVPDADIATFNITNYNTSVWQVVHIDLPPQAQDISHGSSAAAPVPLVDGDDCYADGNNTAFCVISQDPTQCNLAVRIPSTPVSCTSIFPFQTYHTDHVLSSRTASQRTGIPRRRLGIHAQLRHGPHPRLQAEAEPRRQPVVHLLRPEVHGGGDDLWESVVGSPSPSSRPPLPPFPLFQKWLSGRRTNHSNKKSRFRVHRVEVQRLVVSRVVLYLGRRARQGT
ncbi:hypothetical protein GE09DRAFT_1097397, partial [Coniochaeta sp. 2T2.1]